MLIHCDQCHSKYKITIKKIPSKPVNFRCGKCQKNIVISPEELQQDLSPSAEPAPPESTSLGAQVTSPAQPAPPPPAPGHAEADTVQLSCLKCGNSFVKHKDDKARFCYQCRIDQIVTKIKDKYGTTGEAELPEAKSKYTFRSPDGLVLGPIRLKTVAVLIREKRLQGQEEVSKDSADFRPLAEFAELKSLFPELYPAEPTPAPAAEPVAESKSRYHFRSPDGAVLGPMKLKIAAEFARNGKLKGHEEVSKDGNEFRPLADFEELKKLFPDLPAPAAPVPPAAKHHEEEIPLDLSESPPQPKVEAPATPPAPTLGARVPPPASSAPESVSRYKIRYPDGLVLGPIRLLAVEDLVAAGNLTGQEEVQKDNGGWKPFLDYPELKQLLASGEEIAEDEIVELTDLLEEVS